MAFFAPLLAAIGGWGTVAKVGAQVAVGAYQANQQKKANAAAKSYAADVLNEQRAYDRDTLLRVREDAEKAGFNPLTALRNGAANIGANTYMGAPALSSTDFIGQSLMQAIDTGFNAPQRKLDAETQRLQNDLYRAQIGELQANTDYLTRSHGFGIPAVESYGVSDESNSGRGALPALRSDPADVSGSGPDSYNRNVAPELTLFGVDLYGSGRFSNGQTQEDALGDGGPISWAIQPFVLDDMIKTTSAMRSMSRAREYRFGTPLNMSTVDWISGGWKN